MATKKKEETAVLPSSVKVSGYDVAIRPMMGNEDIYSGAYGVYDSGTVSLSLNSPSQRVAMCLVHELLHACFEHSGLRCKYRDVSGNDIEEEVVSTLGFSLAQMIGTEAEFVKFVQNAFAGKPIEVKPECMQIPITGNWVMGEGLPEKMKKTPRKVTM